jgi:hypothetical protein
MWKLLLLAMPLMAQDLTTNFDKMLFEINRTRYDKALTQLFPVQRVILENLSGQRPKFDPSLQSRMNQMADTTAVLSTIALLRSQLDAKQFEEAQSHAMLVGMGLSGLWSKVPPYQRLNFAKQDVEEAAPHQKTLELRKLGYAAVDASEWDTAKKTAAELIAITSRKDFVGPDPGTLKHSALTIRGLAELGLSDVASAEKTLLESMKVQGESVMRLTGPSFRLANELLAKGRRRVVDQFLVLVSESVWRDSSKADEWRKELAADKMPDLPRFSPN